ncbi:hypothetical protein [Parasphingorhabdus cellanae]|uniref:Uncharacterized protein n=1 Tax=Parasphingorhabdus cellanae TaxID=2806553 RepID=A0ABX7T635_9SPHN|nr:hypothetical protein [Parasphingorhabdus cellanae]QTD57066.1 hypothetical protein J4G78_05775 [Parasphingorhabdus cellanae]
MEINIGNMKKRSILKLIFFSALTIYLPLFLIVGGLGASGYDTVTLNGGNVYGVTAVIVSLILCVIFSFVGAAFLTLGAWILGKIRPNSVSIVAKQKLEDVREVFE